MKRMPILLCLACVAHAAALEAAPLRVACVGDSITYGAFIPDRENASYPALLQTLSGGKILVTNLGASGHTLVKTGKLSWWNSPAFAESAAFAPDVVVIMLGTCDVAEPEKLNDYEPDLNALLDHFAGLPSSPRILVATPPPVTTIREWKLNWRLNHRIIPAIRRTCKVRNIPVVDVNSAFQGRHHLIPDALHPNAEGAAIIARTVLDALQSLQVLPPAPSTSP